MKKIYFYSVGKKGDLQLLSIIIIIIGIQLNTSHGQSLIAVQNGNNVSFHSQVNSAITAAGDGDTIYIPGGSWTIGELEISKKLHIYGSGFNTESSIESGITILGGSILLKSGASNGSIVGCYLNPYCYSGCPFSIIIKDSVNNYKISRCDIKSGIQFQNYSKNILISENLIGAAGSGCLYGGAYSLRIIGCNNLITNNVIVGQVSSEAGNYFRNNIISYCTQFCTAINADGTEFENNVIHDCWSPSISNCKFKNNLNWERSGIDGRNNYHQNNYSLDGINFDSIFIQNDGLRSYSSNLRLKPSIALSALGTDGKQVGIYGGLFPWKDGSLPSNPHVQYKQISSTTDQNGNLQINMVVKAQNN